MKKLVGLFLVSMLVLSGCSSNKDKSVTCTLEQDNNKTQYKVAYDDKKVMKSLEVAVNTKAEEEISDSDYELVQSLYNTMFADTKGVEVTTSLADNKKSMDLTVKIDLDKYDYEADELGFISKISSKETFKEMNANEVVKSLKGKGFECGKVE